MKIIQTESIVLNSHSLAEADKIVLFLTEQSGLVRLSVRGAKRMKSRFGGRIEPFTVAEITFAQKENVELGRLVQAETIQSYFHLADNLPVLNALFYFSDVLKAITPLSGPNAKLYRMVRASLNAASQVCVDPQAIRLIAAYFEIWLLRLAGFLPEFGLCSKCQRSVRNQTVYFSAANAQITCFDCANGVRRGEVLDSNVPKMLRIALTKPPLEFVQKAQELNLTGKIFDVITHNLLQKVLEFQPSYWTNQFALETADESTIQAA